MAMSSRMEALVKESRSILFQAAHEHGAAQVFAMVSGGHDSLCALHVAVQYEPLLKAVHCNTTIGIEETREFVRATMKRLNVPLLEYTAPKDYRQIVLERGFPGPGAHRYMYSLLKERSVRRLVREHKKYWGERIMLVTGVRLSESARRMGHVQPIQREGAKLWVAPILNWTDDDKAEYMALHNLPRNPVVDSLCMSGECLCGAFAKPEELAELSVLYPTVANEIKTIQAEAAVLGVPCEWGKRPAGTKAPRKPKSGRMCSSCADLFEGVS